MNMFFNDCPSKIVVVFVSYIPYRNTHALQYDNIVEAQSHNFIVKCQ